jgi:hypothetical protein
MIPHIILVHDSWYSTSLHRRSVCPFRSHKANTAQSTVSEHATVSRNTLTARTPGEVDKAQHTDSERAMVSMDTREPTPLSDVSPPHSDRVAVPHVSTYGGVVGADGVPPPREAWGGLPDDTRRGRERGTL